MVIHSVLDGVRGEFLAVLLRFKSQYGLTDAAIDSLVRGSDFSRPPGGSQIDGTNEGSFVPFLVQGFVKLACERREGEKTRDLMIDLMGPGEFLCMPRIRPPLEGRLIFRVHEAPVTLALLPRQLMHQVTGGHPGENLSRFVLRKWQPARVTQKVILLFLPMPERLQEELLRLGRCFGVPQGDAWMRILPALTQSDLGKLIDRGRSNVNRSWRLLETQGLVAREEGHVLVSAAWLGASR
jgi:hypothetical protein